MLTSSLRRVLAAALALLASATAVRASDWSNAGGNAGRNGQTAELGPNAATMLWSGSRSSIIAWQPVIEGGRVFQVRQTSFPPESTGSPVVCQDLDTGAELWIAHLPANSGDWTTWVAGVSQGRVYASRSGNGSSVAARLHCLDAATGATLWVSQDVQDAGAYDGVVFAPGGDPIVASFRKIWRFDHLTGATVWMANRQGSVSGECGGALYGSAVYVCDSVPGGHALKKFDLASGAFLYQSPVMAGFTLQNTPMAGPDGTLYLSRTQNNVGVDYFYAIADSGSAMSIRWSVPAGWSTVSEFAVGPDGGVFHVAPGNAIHKLDPATGATLATSGPIPADFSAPRIAVDAAGRVFLNNGAFSNGRFYSFDPDLTLRWSVSVPNANIGAPAIGRDGTLVISGVGTNVKAYRTPVVSTFCTAGTTTNGCVASISGTGTPSASAASGFTVAVADVEGAQQGLLFYGLDNAGFAPTPWGTSTSFLCVKSPLERLGVQSSGGAAGTCTGLLQIDWNAYRAANPGALGQPLLAGQHVYAQGWFRDPPSPKTSMLSDALEFVVQL